MRMYRTYKLSHFINQGKLKTIDSLLSEYRHLAKTLSNKIWENFYKTSKINKFFNSKNINHNLSERYKQTCAMQVNGIISSYLANRANDFKQYIYNSSIKDEELRIELLYINKYHLWFKNDITMRDKSISYKTIKLARAIIKHCIKLNSKPNTKNIAMMLDSKVATISKNINSSFDYWIKLSTNLKGKPINLPIITNNYFENINGKLANFVQINKTDGNFHISFIKNIEKESYQPITDKIGLDLGLKTFIATSKGDLLGRNLYPKLQYYDKKIISLIKILQKQGIKPRCSKRYRVLISKLRSYLKNEVNRVINKIIGLYSPKTICVERLNFQNSNLSKRMNRLISNFGKGALRSKLNSLSKLLGIEIIYVNPAYTSQTCSSCGYVSKSNRKYRDEFSCEYCGKKQYSDVSSAKNIEVRSSNILSNIFLSRQLILDKIVRDFIVRHKGFYSKRLSVINNPYFVQVLNSTVKDPINKPTG